MKTFTTSSIEIASMLNHHTKVGMVEFILNGETTRMDLTTARQVLDMLSSAIDAAVSDELMFRYLTTKTGLSDEQAASALLDFRELRQGSRAATIMDKDGQLTSTERDT